MKPVQNFYTPPFPFLYFSNFSRPSPSLLCAVLLHFVFTIGQCDHFLLCDDSFYYHREGKFYYSEWLLCSFTQAHSFLLAENSFYSIVCMMSGWKEDGSFCSWKRVRILKNNNFGTKKNIFVLHRKRYHRLFPYWNMDSGLCLSQTKKKTVSLNDLTILWVKDLGRGWQIFLEWGNIFMIRKYLGSHIIEIFCSLSSLYKKVVLTAHLLKIRKLQLQNYVAMLENSSQNPLSNGIRFAHFDIFHKIFFFVFKNVIGCKQAMLSFI